ncbi:MAG: radical SAM protein [Oscillospiraceae bacterium]|nr:radical SAM protein [Oscillospiraceae bacterium]
MEHCTLCPRKCGADRRTQTGACGAGILPKLARAGVHMWEEPCISGERGSGTVFFSGCSLRCVFCQNYPISIGGYGKEITVQRLREIFMELCEKGVHNINLVNPTHFAPAIAEALAEPLPVPVVYNSSGYERPETLRLLEGKIQIYLPDMKYSNDKTAKRYSHAEDYPGAAKRAIAEMYRQTGPYQMGEDGILKKGVVVRHLILPGNLRNTYGVIDWFRETFRPGQALFSLMSQYIPCGRAEEYPEINRKITAREYHKAQDYLFESEIEDGFVQSRKSAAESFVPVWDLEGV